MVYQGSKIKQSKYLIPIFNKIIKDNDIEYFFDLCVGGANICANPIHKLDCKNIIGTDNNKYLIALLKRVQEDKLEFFIVTREEYTNIRKNKDSFEDWYVGYVGFLQSFGSSFFEGYVKENMSGRNITKERYNNLIKQKDRLKGVKLFHKDIFTIDYNSLPKNSLLYFDPPYANTKKYRNREFDTEKFWEMVTKLSKDFIVLVNEYSFPDNFVSIWNKEKLSTLHREGIYKKDTEHLFVHKSNLSKVR